MLGGSKFRGWIFKQLFIVLCPWLAKMSLPEDDPLVCLSLRSGACDRDMQAQPYGYTCVPSLVHETFFFMPEWSILPCSIIPASPANLLYCDSSNTHTCTMIPFEWYSLRKASEKWHTNLCKKVETWELRCHPCHVGSSLALFRHLPFLLISRWAEI